MTSLAHAIRSFQSGDLSHHEFFAQVDQALAADHTESTRLMEFLSDDHTRVHLPPDVYAELHRRIEHAVEPASNTGSNRARMHTTPTDSMAPRLPPTMSWPAGHDAVDSNQMKGVGDTLNGRFVLEECIGFGGMGTVYRALDLRKLEASDRNPYIAIKVLNVQFRGHPKSLITLQREAKKAQALAHPNIVTVYDFDRDGTTVYLTMEYLSGSPLSHMLRAPDFKGVPYAEAMRIVKGMGRALDYAHERGFVHCDFKPANVILTDSGDVKVIDFGIARVFRKPQDDMEATVFDPGSLGGLTPAYASPEMLEHREPDPRDDIYALACITYELLTGRHPFDRIPATQARGAGMKPQRPKNLGHKQWRALRAALSFDRETRTPTIACFVQGMRAEHSSKKRPAAALGIGMALSALVVAGMAYFWSSQNDRVSQQAPEISAPAEPAGSAVQTAQPTQPAQPALPTLTMESIAPVLGAVPCSALIASISDNTVQVQGFLGQQYGAERLRKTLAAVPGVNKVSVDAREVNDNNCSLLKLLAPYWQQNQQAGRTASARTKQPNAVLSDGDPLILDITTPGYESYVNVDYFSFDGNVLHLVPSPRVRGNQAPANYAATIGGLGNWIVSKPFGTDLIVLLVTPVPLFDRLRPESESAAAYLQAVENRLNYIRSQHGREKIAVDFLQITTQARKP